MDEEKRKTQRQFIDIKVRVGDSYGQSRNISMGGMSCKTNKEVPVMEELPIIIYIDEEDAVKLTGTALRCTPITKDIYDIGIYFNTAKMADETRHELADFLGVSVPDIKDIGKESD